MERGKRTSSRAAQSNLVIIVAFVVSERFRGRSVARGVVRVLISERYVARRIVKVICCWESLLQIRHWTQYSGCQNFKTPRLMQNKDPSWFYTCVYFKIKKWLDFWRHFVKTYESSSRCHQMKMIFLLNSEQKLLTSSLICLFFNLRWTRNTQTWNFQHAPNTVVKHISVFVLLLYIGQQHIGLYKKERPPVQQNQKWLKFI